MGCFPCFDSREEKTLNPHEHRDDHKDVYPNIPSNILKLSSGADKLKTRSNVGLIKEPSVLKDLPSAQMAAQIFTFCELAAATNNFRPECFLGEGGFGHVYRGRHPNGQVVAVEQLDRNGLQGNKEFLVEVLMLSLLHHFNLVNLVGYCAEGEQRLLVYEFMPLGSLEDNLHGPTGDKSHLSTRVMGTYGYCAPEYAMTEQLTVKSDVYSFGVVFLELITGRIAIDSTFHRENKTLLHGHDHYSMTVKNSRNWQIQDCKVSFSFVGFFKALAIASMRIQEQSPGRPLIGDVVTALSYLANQTYDSSIAVGSDNRIALEKDDNRSKDERGRRTLSTEKGEGSGQKWNLDGFERDDSPRENVRNLNRDLDRERAVAEAKMWGEILRKNNVQRNFDGNNGL